MKVYEKLFLKWLLLTVLHEKIFSAGIAASRTLDGSNPQLGTGDNRPPKPRKTHQGRPQNPSNDGIRNATTALTSTAVAVSDVSAEAVLSVSFAQTVGVTALGFVTDDGQSPLTTYALRDPDGITGSSAVAVGSVTYPSANSLRFVASDFSQAVGAPDPLIEMAWAQTSLGGGLLIENSLSADIDATIALEWSWVMGLAAAGSPIDLGVGQLSMELLIDGFSLAFPVDELLSAPGSGPFAGNGTFTTTVTVPAQSSREISLVVFSLGVAQSTVSEAPVPGTPFLLLPPLVLLRLASRRRCVAQDRVRFRSCNLAGGLDHGSGHQPKPGQRRRP